MPKNGGPLRPFGPKLRKVPFFRDTIVQQMSLSLYYFHSCRRYLATLLKSIFCIHEKYLLFFLTFLKSLGLLLLGKSCLDNLALWQRLAIRA